MARTVPGGVAALLLCFPASRNLAPDGTIYFLARRALEFFRATTAIKMQTVTPADVARLKSSNPDLFARPIEAPR